MEHRFTPARLVAIAVALLFTFTAFAQENPTSGKMSVSTRIFLRQYKANKGRVVAQRKARRNVVVNRTDTVDLSGKALPAIASPVEIDGKYYISAFVRVDGDDAIDELKANGVIVRNKFSNGLLTTYIPVDSVERVAAIASVKRVNVASLMSTSTAQARKLTNVDDILTLSADAQNAGLNTAYDGKGVVMGVVDEGIDFKHRAFQDADGNSRIKRVYAKTSSDGTAQEYTNSADFPATDNADEDHGTHTSSTAGGSSVIVSGSNVTVTNDHGSATYGGMAPGSDLYLVGTNDLDQTIIADGFQKIVHYADSVDEPVVISNSWGATMGLRDGTSDFGDVVDQYFGDDYPNHVCLFASSNDGGEKMYLHGKSTKANPLGTVVTPYSYSQGSSTAYLYLQSFADIWTHEPYDGELECKIMVIQRSRSIFRTTYSVAKTVTVTPTEEGTYVSGLSDYITDSIFVFKDGLNYNPDKRTEVVLYAFGSIGDDGYYSGYVQARNSNYQLAFQIYPKEDNASLDFYMYTIPNLNTFTSVSTSGYTWTEGDDRSSVSPEATLPNVISIGAYASLSSWRNYNNRSVNYASYMNSVGDIADFSSYQAPGEGITGEKLPWITAPGQMVVSAVNSNSSTYTTGSNASSYRVNGSTTYPYAVMQGTSMATPVAAGIVALWLQAAKEHGGQLTNNDVKDIMKQTAITDNYTSGSNADRFGNGKIDALAGVKYIIDNIDQYKATPTGIADVHEAVDADDPQAPWYTIDGIRLTGEPSAPGLYIHGGKKVVKRQ